jgi:drug/metabolite transporter superfamily protein YnfA
VTLAGADTPVEHLQLSAFTAVAAVVFIWLGLRQRRTGRSALAPGEVMRTTDRLIPPTPPSRGQRAAGCMWIGFGGVFILPAVFNFLAAIHELIG